MDSTSKISRSIRTTKETNIVKKPPKGATIIESTETTTSEQIENGWLMVKNHSGRYTTKDSKDTYGNYYDYSEKYYSKDDPMINDKSLADAFDDDNDGK